MTKTAAAAPKPNPIEALIADLNASFPERRDVVDGCMAAILSGEHVLLLGPPGTAKSALVRAIAQAFGGSYFERLLTRFSTPEELFGPVSLKALEEDRYARVTTGKLPEAEWAFVDECFKANSAILNSLLTAMNERIFHNDGAPMRMPLVSLFGASNELPEGKELEALYDRFLVRFDVQYLLRPSNMRAMLLAPEPAAGEPMTMADLRAAQAEVDQVKVTDATVDALLAIRDALRAEGIVSSDRRWKKALKLAKAAAWLAGESETCPEDLTILCECLWREPSERAKLARVVGQIADPVSAKAAELLDAARETVTKVQSLARSDRKAYIAAAAQSLDEFKAQSRALEQLAAGAARRAKKTIADAKAEIASFHADIARAVSHGLGLSR